MIKFCIALALLATISLSTDICNTNVILELTVTCLCHATDTSSTYKMCDYSKSGCYGSGTRDTRSNYCKRVGKTYTMVDFPVYCSASTYLKVGIAVNAKYTGADCKIDDDDTPGNKICTQNGVYKVTATSCPLIPACPKDQILSGDTPCFCYTDTAPITGAERNNNAASGKFCNSRSSDNPSSNPAVKTIGVLEACTAFDKIENKEYCLSKAHTAGDATGICYEDQYTDGTKTNGCTDWSTCTSQAKNLVFLTAPCECVANSNELCKKNSYCWPDTTKSCNAAKKTCATGKMADGSIYACSSSGNSYVTASADTLCPENTGSGTGCVDATCCKPTCTPSDTVAIPTVGGCVCETGVVCAKDKFCLKGNKCTDAAKDCVHGEPNVGTIYSCTGTGWTYVTANNATPCPSGVCNDDTCCMANCSTFDCGKLDKTTTDCPSTGCTKLLCCEAFISSNSALTIGVQTAAFMVIMIFI